MAAGKDREDGGRYLYPHLLFEILCLALFVFELVFFLAVLFPPPIRREVNFAFPFAPKPAWYFLPLYELVKYFPGRLVFLGASVLPLLALAAAYAVPWVDRRPERKLSQRIRPALAAAAVGAFVLFLLVQGWRS